jgi:hypothetical protein
VFTVTASFFPGSMKPTERLQRQTDTEDPNVHTPLKRRGLLKCGWKRGESDLETVNLRTHVPQGKNLIKLVSAPGTAKAG